ncbi:MAG: DUF1616 domain-containing protein [Candidatus Bathyarchaeia archaeon]|jgi:hypothetical protein
MRLIGYKIGLFSVGLIGILLLASPVLSNVIHLPPEEQFSELYLLGPNQKAQDYPYNIDSGQNYSIYIGVGNRLGSAAYYAVNLKLLNETDSLPNATVSSPSPLQSLYTYQFLLPKNQSVELPLAFSFSGVYERENQSSIRSMSINNNNIEVNKAAIWNSNSTAFTYRLLVELWAYNAKNGAVEYDNRYVYLQLNLTSTLP